MVISLLINIWHMLLSAAPWLLIGLVFAAMIKAWAPTHLVVRAMGGKGLGAVARASLVGIPLPLCSCGVLPTAVSLRRQGASRSATASFLISTPEIGVESFTLSYALLGPFMAITRPIAAFITAFAAGAGATYDELRYPETDASSGDSPDAAGATCCEESASPVDAGCCAAAEPELIEQADCCGDQTAKAPAPDCCSEQAEPQTATACCPGESTEPADCCEPGSAAQSGSCCGGSAAGPVDENAPSPGAWRRLGQGLVYVSSRLIDDIKLWLIIAIILAGAVITLFPDQTALANVGSGPLAMVVMLFIGVPLYVCATASTPLAAGLLAAGVSPGTVLVFLLAGPATNIGSIGVLRKELGWPVLSIYLLCIAVCSLAVGLVADLIVNALSLNIAASAAHAHEFMPAWVSVPSAILLIVLMIKPLRQALGRLVRLRPGGTTASTLTTEP